MIVQTYYLALWMIRKRGTLQNFINFRVERYNRLFVIDSLNLFREGIKPVWEDPLNQNGYDLRLELDVYSDNREQTEITYKLLWQN